VYFRRDSFLSQLISVLLAWAMIMSSLPVYATDQPHAKWVHSWDFGSGPKATTPSPHKDVSATVARSAVLWARRNISRNAGLPSRLARITRVLAKKPINPRSSFEFRLAIAVPTGTSYSPVYLLIKA
jgi:hypothetical protein